MGNNELPLSEDAIKTATGVYIQEPHAYIPYRANTKRFEVQPGKYILLPFTESSNKELKFFLRLFSEMPAKLELVN